MMNEWTELGKILLFILFEQKKEINTIYALIFWVFLLVLQFFSCFFSLGNNNKFFVHLKENGPGLRIRGHFSSDFLNKF